MLCDLNSLDELHALCTLWTLKILSGMCWQMFRVRQ